MSKTTSIMPSNLAAVTYLFLKILSNNLINKIVFIFFLFSNTAFRIISPQLLKLGKMSLKHNINQFYRLTHMK